MEFRFRACSSDYSTPRDMSGVIDYFYEFETFRVDPTRRLLERDGQVVPLKPKVFDTLLALVESGGEILEKERLLHEVWGGASVEEVGLAKNISTLRKALGESPDEHRFIVTIPGRGYRFVATVTRVHAGIHGTEDTPPLIEQPSPPIASGVDPAAAHFPSSASSRRSRWTWIGIGTALILVAGISAVVVWQQRQPALTDHDTVLLAEFENRTGEPVFDGTLRQGLAVQLDQSSLLNTFPDARVRRTLQLMGRSADDKVTPAIAREICQRQGLKAFITGSIAPLGSHYVITLEAVDGRDGAALARTQMESQTKEQVLRTLSNAVSELRQKLGESLASIQKSEALLERSTPSLEALRAYSLGNQENRRGKSQQAIALYRRAVELDPNFAYAYGALAVAYRNQRQPGLAGQFVSKAFSLRSRLSERESLYMTSLYHELVTGDIGKNLETLQLFARTYPHLPLPHNNLAVAYVTLGQFENAVDEGRIALRLDPTSSVRYGVVGNALLRLSRFSEARDLYRRALDQQLNSLSICRGMFRLAFVDQDETAMERQLSWARSNGFEHAAFDWRAGAAAYAGQWHSSVEFSRRASEVARRSEQPELASLYAADSSLRGAALGQCAWARTPSRGTQLAEADTSEQSYLSQTRHSLALALCGARSQAQSSIEGLMRSYPKHTIVNWIWLPAIQAALEIGRGNSAQAVEALRPALRYEAAAEFWPQYLRGQAYLRMEKGKEAEAEFRKIIEHRGHDVVSPLYPLSSLGLARAAELNHDTPEARKWYQRFLAQWREADSDLPALLEANKAYANLR